MAFSALPTSGLPSSLTSGLSSPMQLVPLSSLTGGGFGSGFGGEAAEGSTSLSVSSFGLLPFLLTHPLGWILVLVIVIVLRITIVLVLPIIAPKFSRRLFGVKKPPTTEKPYPYYDSYYDDEHDEYGAYGKPYAGGMRRRRSATPALGVDQVEKLTRIVFNAIQSQECMQRVICEAGSVSKAYSDSAHSMARAVAKFVPSSLKESYNIFAEPDSCEKFSCGTAKSEKRADD